MTLRKYPDHGVWRALRPLIFASMSLCLLAARCENEDAISLLGSVRVKAQKAEEASPQSADALYASGSCYWMEDQSGTFQWVPASTVGVDGSIRQCYEMDSCDGGLGYSSGGCFKWAESADGPRVPWPSFSSEPGVDAGPAPSRYAEPCEEDRASYKDWPLHFRVKIVSGTLQGSEFWGAAKYPAEDMQASGSQTLELSAFVFCYLGPLIKLEGFDPLYGSRPNVSIQDGRVVRLNGVGGDQHRRFGFNGGFERFQFGREEESFINEGKDYFGYLNPATLVDGAGLIFYDWP